MLKIFQQCAGSFFQLLLKTDFSSHILQFQFYHWNYLKLQFL